MHIHSFAAFNGLLYFLTIITSTVNPTLSYAYFESEVMISPYKNEYKDEHYKYNIYIEKINGDPEIASLNTEGKLFARTCDTAEINNLSYGAKQPSNYALWPFKVHINADKGNRIPPVFSFKKIEDIQNLLQIRTSSFIQERKYNDALNYINSWSELLDTLHPSQGQSASFSKKNNFKFVIMRDVTNMMTNEIGSSGARNRIEFQDIKIESEIRRKNMNLLREIAEKISANDRSTGAIALYRKCAIELNNWAGFMRLAYREGQHYIPDTSIASTGLAWFRNNDEEYKALLLSDLTEVRSLIQTKFIKSCITEITDKLSKNNLHLKYYGKAANPADISNLFDNMIDSDQLNIAVLGTLFCTLASMTPETSQ